MVRGHLYSCPIIGKLELIFDCNLKRVRRSIVSEFCGFPGGSYSSVPRREIAFHLTLFVKTMNSKFSWKSFRTRKTCAKKKSYKIKWHVVQTKPLPNFFLLPIMGEIHLQELMGIRNPPMELEDPRSLLNS